MVILRKVSKKTSAHLFIFAADIYIKPAFDKQFAGKEQCFQKSELL